MIKFQMSYFRLIAIALLILTTVSSCIIVKHDDEYIQIEPEIAISPKPIIPLSENMIRSVKGDMIAFLPQGWFVIDPKDKVSPDIIAIAINPEYNLSAVFSVIRHSATVQEAFEGEGLYGVARMSLGKRERKTSSVVRQVGKYQKLNIGLQEFVKYEYSTTGGAVKAKSVVFISTANEFYEFSLVPMIVDDNPLPSFSEADDIFTSILTGIKY
ncbi:MAG: hypothetical protein M9949_02575 [Candidatus Kapabacteria bacterium]|nr:hypothetical protein [Candidatus Kapabacteria bacterium]